jgi:hypothetical protein
VEKKQQAQEAAAAAGELADFKAKRDQALAALTNSRRQRYAALAEVCRQIEQSINAVDDPRVQKLEELMWTFLASWGSNNRSIASLNSRPVKTFPACSRRRRRNSRDSTEKSSSFALRGAAPRWIQKSASSSREPICSTP